MILTAAGFVLECVRDLCQRMKKFFLLLILIPVFLVSCASARFESRFSPVYVTNTSKYAVLPTAAMDGVVDGVERMTAAFGGQGQSFDFDVYVISDAGQLSMTVFNEFGTTMASLFYDGVSLDFDSAVFPKSLKAEYIVADFQFCLYRADELAAALAKIGVDFEVTRGSGDDGSATETRVLSKKGKIISKITKICAPKGEGGAEIPVSVRYENFLRGYSYTLTGAGE